MTALLTPSASRRLIVNADDLGLCCAANRAIAAAFRHGALSSVSLMVTTAAFDDAVSTAHRDRLAIGLHFTLTTGKAVSPPRAVPLLVDREGRFRHTCFGLWRLLRSSQGRAAQRQIVTELAAQWRRAGQAGLSPGHLDSHQHIHMLPALFPQVAEFARTQHLPLRITNESKLPRLPSHISGRAKRWLLSHLARKAVLTPHLTTRSDQMLGIAHGGGLTADLLLQFLERLPAGTTELITHPGGIALPSDLADLNRADQRFHTSPARLAECAALHDPRVAALREQLNITLVRHNEDLNHLRKPFGQVA